MSLEWPTIVAFALIVGLPVVAWFRKVMMLQALALTNFLVFLLGAATARRIDGTIFGSPLLADLAFRPEYVAPHAWGHLYTLVTAMFLHADVLHIVANMVIFVFMGLGLEERIGRGRFLFLYLFSGIGATLIHAMTNFSDPIERMIPVVGASGAVFGIIAAYATLYPRDKVMLFVIIILPRVPVYIAAMVYTVMELFAILGGAFGNVARYAHVGGLIFGVIGALLIGRDRTVGKRRRVVQEVSLDTLRGLVETEEQTRIYGKLVENRDEPELYAAWMEKFALATACPRCGRRFEASAGGLKCSCGNRIRVG